MMCLLQETKRAFNPHLTQGIKASQDDRDQVTQVIHVAV
jgi:hypothetical protein